jgi:DNA-binding phage protein
MKNKKSTCFVYFAVCSESNMFKIGVSTDPYRRRFEVEHSFGVQIDRYLSFMYILKTSREARSIEHIMHKLMSIYGYSTEHNEWFTMDGLTRAKEVMDEIGVHIGSCAFPSEATPVPDNSCVSDKVNSDARMAISDMVERARTVKSMSVATLSSLAGISRATHYHAKSRNGNITINHLISMMHALGILDEFICSIQRIPSNIDQSTHVRDATDST